MKIDWDLSRTPERRVRWRRLRTWFGSSAPLCHSNHYDPDHFKGEHA